MNITTEEKQLLREFWNNEPLRNAVKKHLLSAVSRQVNIEDPINHWIYTIDRSWDNDKFANLVKLVAQAQHEVKDAFEHIADLAADEPEAKTTEEEYK